MKLRTLAPRSIQQLGRHTAVLLAQPTAKQRIRPGFIVAGGQRCGTTSLFRALEQHPQMVRPTAHKGINYFDLNYHRGPRWYAAHFPLEAVARRRVPGGTAPIAFEASGYYMFHPAAVPRLARDLPDVKLVIMLRDPVERAYSAWKHEKARGYETEDFVTALRLEHQRVDPDDAGSGSTDRGFSHRHHAYTARSDYATQVEKILEHIPRDRLHVIYSEDFFATPPEEFTRLTEFLGAQAPGSIVYDQHNARPSGSMPEEARALLRPRLQRTYEELETLTGRRPPWAC